MKPEADKKYLKSMLIIHYAALGLCRSFTSCAAPLPAVLFLYQLCCSFTSCAIPLPAVPFLYQLCCSFTSCAVPLPAVPFLYQLCRSFTSCAAPLPAVPLLYQLCCAAPPPLGFAAPPQPLCCAIPLLNCVSYLFHNL